MIKKQKIYEARKYENLKELVDETVKLYPDENVFILKENNGKNVEYKNITFEMFGNDINYLGTKLIQMGLKGKRVAVIGKNRYEWSVSYLATTNGVGVIVPLDKGLPESEIELSLKRSKAEAVIFEDSYIDIMKNIKQNNNTFVKYYICMDDVNESEIVNLSTLLKEGKEELKTNKEYIEAEIDREKVSVLVFTSGTTSLSKVVMLSQKNIVENIYSLDCAIKVTKKDTSLAFLPFHHTFGWTVFLFFFKNGVTSAFCDGIRYIQDNLKEYKISLFVCVPLILEALYKKINISIEKNGMTQKVKFGKKISNILLKFGIDIRRKLFKDVIDQLGGHLRLTISGAAGIDKEVVKGFNEFGIKSLQGYGLTETSPVISIENDKHIRYGSIGFPLYNVEVKVDDPNEEGIGEIIARGPNVMLGYYENEEATKEVLIDGWFYTGDLGCFDKDGYLFITGRKKNVIVLKNGKNIYPEELELLINNLNYVAESMVFGYPKDDDLLLSVKIVYNKDVLGDLSKKEIYDKIWKDIKEINSGLTNYKHIKKLIITDEPMIKTTTQKVKRFHEVKKIVEESK